MARINVRDTGAFRLRLGELREAYAEEMAGRARAIVDAWQPLKRSAWKHADVVVLYRFIHGLAGSGGSLGYPQVGEAAHMVEAMLVPFLEGSTVMDGRARAELDARIVALSRLAIGGADEVEPAPDSEPGVETKLVYLIENDAAAAHQLSLQFQDLNYAVDTFATPRRLAAAIADRAPCAILLALDDPGALDAVCSLANAHSVPFFVVSDRDDVEWQLRVARHGAAGHLARPFDVSAFVQRLEFGLRGHMPFRVLLVSSHAHGAGSYAVRLRKAGFDTATVLDANMVTRELTEFQPDVVIVDYQLENCTGAELASVLHQQDSHAELPVLILAPTTVPNRQLAKLQTMGDAVLIEPLEDDALFEVVRARAYRRRVVRSFISRDALTSVLNHGAILETLQLELHRATRGHTPVAFAMVDIDRFKSINDTRGHPMGDRALRLLARLLRQTLRRVDQIGRYGGDEFAIVFPSTPGSGAFLALEQVRERFATSRLGGDADVQVTFSAGVSSFPQHGDAAGLVHAADRALYRAKQLGRNRVVEE